MFRARDRRRRRPAAGPRRDRPGAPARRAGRAAVARARPRQRAASRSPSGRPPRRPPMPPRRSALLEARARGHRRRRRARHRGRARRSGAGCIDVAEAQRRRPARRRLVRPRLRRTRAPRQRHPRRAQRRAVRGRRRPAGLRARHAPPSRRSASATTARPRARRRCAGPRAGRGRTTPRSGRCRWCPSRARRSRGTPASPGFRRLDEILADAEARVTGLEGVDGKAVLGLTGEELAAFGAQVDLLVIGSRGYGPLHRVMFGSTAMHLAGHARCPLVVLTRARRSVVTPESRAGRPTAPEVCWPLRPLHPNQGPRSPTRSTPTVYAP